MTLWNMVSPAFETLVERSLYRREAQAATLASSATPDLAHRVTSLARDYGQVMQPGVILALAQSGMDSDPDIVRFVAKAESQRELSEATWNDEGRPIRSKLEQAGRLIRTPFMTQPETDTQKAVSAPWRFATSPFRTGVAKGMIRGATTGADMVWEELVSRPVRTMLGAANEMGVNPLQARVNPFTGLPGQIVEDPEKLAAAQNQEGFVSDIYSRTGRSAGLVAIQEGMGLGEGFFPGDQAGHLSMAEREGPAALDHLMPAYEGDPELQDRLQSAASQTMLRNGKPLSTGRFIAGEHFDPDTTAFNIASGLIDATLAWKLDPTAAATKGASARRNLRRNFGVVDGPRQGVDRDAFVNGFLRNDRQGRALVSRLATSDDWEDVYLALGSNKVIPNQLVTNLVDATSEAEVLSILDRNLGFTISRPGRRTVHNTLAKMDENGLLDRRPFRTLRNLEDRRILADMPAGHVSAQNMSEAIPQLRNYMINANLPTDLRKKHMARFGRIGDNQDMALKAALSNMYKDIDATLDADFVRLGVSIPGEKLNLAQRFNKILNDYLTEGRLYDIDELGNIRKVPGGRRIMQNGQWVEVPSATTLSDYSLSTFPLLDIREVKDAAATLGRIKRAIPGFNPTSEHLESLMSVWKTSKLARVGWPMRITLDEQLRLASTGLDSMFSHPIRWLGYVVGQKGDLLKDGSSVEKLLADSVEFQKAMSRPGNKHNAFWRGGSITNNDIYTGDFVLFTKGVSKGAHFREAWFGNLRQLETDPIAKRVAGGLTPEDMATISPDSLRTPYARRHAADPNDPLALKEWFWSGSGAKYREELAAQRGSSTARRMLAEDDATRYGYKTYEEALTNSRQFADDIIDQVYRERVRIVTGDNPNLRQFIATGKLNGRKAGLASDKKFLASLDEYIDYAPVKVKGARYIDPDEILTNGPMQKLGAQADKATKAMFTALGSLPSDTLARAPAYRQLFWQRVSSHAIYMTPKVRAEAATKARAAGLPKVADDILKVGTDKGAKQSHYGLSNWDDVVFLAKTHALTEVRRTLYALDKRSQFMDTARLIFPFGEAFKEIFQTWARLIPENPTGLRRAQQTFNGGVNSGVFYQDEDTGEQMFGYRGGGIASRMMGLPENSSIRMEGRVRDLNLLSTTVIPGVGPIVAWPASRFIPDHPDWDWLEEIILPFGRDETSTPGQFIDSMAPPWAKELLQALSKGEIDEVAWNNNVKDIAAALILGGEYDETELDEALEHASKKGQMMFLIRSLAKSSSPSSVKFSMEYQDQEGRWFTIGVLSDEFRKMVEKHNGDEELAVQEFIEEYGFGDHLLDKGTAPFILTQPRSKTLKHRALEVTGANWERANADLVSKYDLTIGLVAPITVDDDFDMDAYINARELDTTKPLTDRQQLEMANHIRGSLKYRQLREAILARDGRITDAMADALRLYKRSLMEELPGYSRVHETIPEGGRLEDQIRELQQMAGDSDTRITSLPTFAPMTEYLEVREAIVAKAKSMGFDTLASKDLAEDRALLSMYGDALAAENPDFMAVWERILRREVEDDG